MDAEMLDILKQAHSSLCIRFGTDAPFAIGPIRGEKVGYAQDPCVALDVTCRDEDLSALVPIVRQRVYGELAERGWGPDDVQFTPMTLRWRRRKFRDENESSSSYGRDKFGIAYRFTFRMESELARATFTGFGSFRPLPDRAE
jgi:hypothetical protein